MAANVLTWGFTQWADQVDELVSVIGESVVFKAVEDSASHQTEKFAELMSSLVQVTTDHKKTMQLPGGGTLQPLDENGNPYPVKEGGSHEVALPMQNAGTAWGTTRESRASMTIKQMNRFVLENSKRDTEWMRIRIMAAFLDNTTWSYADKKTSIGTLTIQPLANADGTLYPIIGGGTEDSQHYFATSDPIDDDHNPFPTIYTQLKQHFGNEGNVIAFVPTSLKTTIEALSDFTAVVDVDIEVGAMAETIRANTAPIKQFGDEVLGKVNKVWIVEWKRLPAGYIFAYDDGAEAVVGQRQMEAQALRGFFAEEGVSNGTLKSTNLIRYAGFGILNRVGAVVYQIGNGSYEVPDSGSTPASDIDYNTPVQV